MSHDIFGETLDRAITAAKERGTDLDDIISEMEMAIDGLRAEIEDIANEDDQ